jgi:hypothetical protein
MEVNGHISGMTPEQVAEAVSYIQAAAPERGSAEHFSAIRELLDLFSDDQVPASVVEPSAIGALGSKSPLDRLKAIDAAFVMAVARHMRSDLETPTDIALMNPLNAQPKVMTAAEMAAASNPEATAAAVTIGKFGELEISSEFREELRKVFTESQIDRGLERAPANMGSTRDPMKIMQQVRRCCSYAKQDDDGAEKRRLGKRRSL